MVKPPAPATRPAGPPTERDRLNRPQPPRAIPPRGARPAPAPGNVAYALLGAQVIK
jgi:hypothetical protein